MIRVRTPSRLHFGLFSVPSVQASLRRRFGGVGLMIDRPGIEIGVEPATAWAAQGPLAERALSFAKTYCAAAKIEEFYHLRVASAAPEHAGLGTGTQLGLAVARAIAELTGEPARDAVTLAKQVDRGLRSALGVHGFDRGGLLVEGGKTAASSISPLLVRLDFPDDWRILLITPEQIQGIHGQREIEAFADLAQRQRDERNTEILCRLVLLDMLPALLERNLDTFGEALHEFNRRVGETFRHSQGSLYAHPRIEAIVTSLRDAGVKGVGQSSWGPSIFAVVGDGEAMEFSDWLAREQAVNKDETIVTGACNRGAEII